ncbi:hypothetical protein QUB63_13180 [Microcoleus sp. ARI1-B5]|uniref:hypothetical protein n=1 Tax=unclassified Microcoleus TaxID=2642155 RepID=UPI002FD68ED9
MNSILLISPSKAWGFQPILSGKKRAKRQSANGIRDYTNFRPRNARLERRG